MTNLTIDRLTLKLSGLSEPEGQRLAQNITQKLARSDLASREPSDIAALQVTIPTRPNASIDWLAEQIVTSILRQLNQTLG
ncbi:hypothetical protein [uncultured Nostoc sp.]|uniref:hypothetical protein n=1 Tax=uncultured Nostoc sp. TaxID=340711 RepID=UPI0035CA68C5